MTGEEGSDTAVRRALALLEERQAEVLNIIADSSAELADLNAMIGTLRARISGHPAMTTQQAVRAYYEPLPPGTRIVVPVLLAHVEARGWRSPARDRARALSTFLVREAGKGRLRKGPRRGEYFTR